MPQRKRDPYRCLWRGGLQKACSDGRGHPHTTLSDENELIADWLVALTNAKRSWGFSLCFLHLRNVKGFGWNHKCVYRIDLMG